MIEPLLPFSFMCSLHLHFIFASSSPLLRFFFVSGRGIGKKKPRDSSPLVPWKPTSDKRLTLEIRGDSKTVVDWVNGHAKVKSLESTITTAQNLLWRWWSRGVDLRRRVADWAVLIFREQNKDADVGAGERRQRSRRGMDCSANVAWSEVASLCGFWDGSNSQNVRTRARSEFLRRRNWRLIWFNGWTVVRVDAQFCCGLSAAQCVFRRNALHAGGPLPPPPLPPLPPPPPPASQSVGGLWLGCARLCGAG